MTKNSKVILAISLMVFSIITLCIPMVYAMPPLERVTPSNLTTSEENDTLQVGEQSMINVDYMINSNRNEQFTLIFQITDKYGQVVMLN